MTELERQLNTALADLIGVLHQQAQELERLISHVEQQTARLPYRSRMSEVLSELSELRHRVRSLAEAGAPA